MSVRPRDSRRLSIPRKPVPHCRYDGPGTRIVKTPVRQTSASPQLHSNDVDALSAQRSGTAPQHIPSSDLPSLGGRHQRPAQDCAGGVESEADGLVSDSTISAKRTGVYKAQLKWMPYTLQWPYLHSLILLSLGLAAVVGILTGYSMANNGLARNSNSIALLFGWRFSPTLLAVAYVLLETMLLVDVRRTEVFARLVRNSTSSARDSILHGVDSWWNDPSEALRKQKDGGWRSWGLFWASLANIIGTLVISPLSAGLLSIEDMQIATPTEFNRVAAFHETPLVATADDATYVRSIASSTLGLTTSAWLSDEYAVLPFWPASMARIPLGSSLATSPQTWVGTTTVFQVTMDCQLMWLSQVGYQPAKELYPASYTPQPPTDVPAYISLQLTSADGCIYEFAIWNDSISDLFLVGGGWWSDTTSQSYGQMGADSNQSPNIVVANSTECDHRDVFFVTTPFRNNSTRAAGQLCSSEYYEGDLETTVTTSTSQSSVSFDKKLYEDLRRPMGTSFDKTSFEALFHGTEWATKFQPPTPPMGNNTGGPSIGGPLLTIAALHNFDIESLMNNASVVQQAKATKQRFFGEALQNKFESIGAQKSTASFSGQVIFLESRVAVNFAVGISLGVLFLLSAAMFTLVLWYSRLERRPLGLSRDPASAAAIAALIVGHDSRFEFHGTDRVSNTELNRLLGSKSWRLRAEELSTTSSTTTFDKQKKASRSQTRSDWRPAVLRGWSGAMALLFMTTLIIAISVLYAMSKASALHETFFVYQKTYSIGKGIKANIAPYSIIPTLLAIVLKLWWGGLEGTFKRLQPYVQMARQPTKAAQGVTLSYADSVLLWASWKAAKNKHWLLGSITTGAFLIEVFTVTMSAIWSRQAGVLALNRTIPRQLELRSLPSIFTAEPNTDLTAAEHLGDVVLRSILIQIYGSVLNSWLYAGLVDLAYNGSRPAWTTEDHWSFAPVDTTQLSIPTIQNVGSNFSTLTSSQSSPSANITLDTPSMRARIECTELDLSNTSAWITTLNFTDSVNWDTSTLIPGLSVGYSLSASQDAYFPIDLGPYHEVWSGNLTTFFADDYTLVCCANMTNGEPGQAAIGYWSVNTDRKGYTAGNFTVKWIVGKPYGQLAMPQLTSSYSQQFGFFVWKKIPKMTALNCMPIFETASAVVTVDVASATVQQYHLTTRPLNDSTAWSDPWLVHGNQTLIELGSDESHVPTVNVTVSYGWLFLESLLSAADTAGLADSNSFEGVVSYQNPFDKTFNFRQTGLNTDFMSYASLALQNNDIEALLDPDVLYSTSNKVFATFFQHFVSNNISMEQGSYGFQAVGATLPWDLPLIFNEDSTSTTVYQDQNATSHFSNSVNATIHVDIQQLHMPPVAVCQSLSILAILLAITCWIYTRHRQYFKALPRDVDSIASVLGFVYASPKLLKWVDEHKHLEDWGLGKGDEPEVMARMGWFDGNHWGIELLDEGEGKGFDANAGGGRASQSNSTVSDEGEALATAGGG
ncbi:uncharacterized protein PV07_03385 [Cladophialophora immunda]|uniref:Uncharacterized protein n=1 Tax=Cladophialophora immunda TaxID=569365 RepID=A0A0D2CKS9_9EURO|nr:uncharacterized protein PV07_03385 [Cladophialophora immunda]KIW31793.1 hypothetical protein PV07_03385 [Cladophialophora immunda]